MKKNRRDVKKRDGADAALTAALSGFTAVLGAPVEYSDSPSRRGECDHARERTTAMSTPIDETELTVRHGATLRERYPLLMAQPSPTITPIAAQAEARGEPVPVGKTAAEVRAAGYVVAVDVPDTATLDPREPTNDDATPLNISSTGCETDFEWNSEAIDATEWLIEKAAVLAAMTPESIAQEHEFMLYTFTDAVRRAERLPVGTQFFAALASVARVIGLLEAEAHRREKLLETAAKFSLAT